MRVVALIATLASCDPRAPIARCTDDLAGVYEVETTAARWSILDHRRSLEVYPLFDDSQPVAGLETAPRVIDLRRTDGEALVGEITRRYMKAALRCDAKVTARVTSCKDDTLEIVLADPVPPLTYEPCTWGQSASSRRERWHRVK